MRHFACGTARGLRAFENGCSFLCACSVLFVGGGFTPNGHRRNRREENVCRARDSSRAARVSTGLPTAIDFEDSWPVRYFACTSTAPAKCMGVCERSPTSNVCPFLRYPASTAGSAQSRSEPSSIAMMVDEPGITFGRLKLPSRSLSSRRRRSRFASGFLGTRTIIAPETPFPARFAKPSTMTEPPTSESAMVSDAPGGTFNECPEIVPASDAMRTTEYDCVVEPAATSYLPGMTSEKLASPRLRWRPRSSVPRQQKWDSLRPGTSVPAPLGQLKALPGDKK